MEALGFERAGKITLIGFAFFAIFTVLLVNNYWSENKEYQKRAQDMELSNSVFLDTKRLDALFGEIDNTLYTGKIILETLLQENTYETQGLTDQMVYSEANNVSTLDVGDREDLSSIGNIIINGQAATLDPSVQSEINRLDAFFLVEKRLFEKQDFDMTSVYYSAAGYVSYYPYTKLEAENVDSSGVFERVNQLIRNIQQEQKNDPVFSMNKVWNSASLDEENNVGASISAALPVAQNDTVVGILAGSIVNSELDHVFTYLDENAEVYLLDQNNNVVYSSDKKVIPLTPMDDVVATYDKDLRYYTNKFPVEFEIREHELYTLYISALAKENWHLVYVMKNRYEERTGYIATINILLGFVIALVFYASFKYNSKKREHLESIIRSSRFDGMTELLNHEHILDAFRKVLKNKRITKISVMMMDIDDFKMINDTYGHGVGDDVIKICAQTIKNIVENAHGECGRYGGEEFMVVLGRLGPKASLEIAEEIRAQINDNIEQALGLPVTASIGIQHVEKPILMDIGEIIDLADKNLYKAKKSGKNQVVMNEIENGK